MSTFNSNSLLASLCLCQDCMKKLQSSGFRITRVPRKGWWPSPSQEAFIKENWDKLPNTEIARRFNITTARLEGFARKVNLPRKAINHKHLWPQFIDLYINAYWKVSAIAEYFNVSQTTVQFGLKSSGIALGRDSKHRKGWYGS